MNTNKSRRIANALLAFSVLGGCADTPKDNHQFHQPDPAVFTSVDNAAVESSAKLFASQDLLQTQIERRSLKLSTELLPPDEDPLSQKQISINVKNAPVGELLGVLATEFGINLSVEPAVLELPQVANFQLQNVNGRQTLNQMLSTFDIVGKLGTDNVLSVKLTEERLFDVETLIGKTSIDISAGGDVFGTGSKGGNSLKDSVNLTGDYGDKGDVLDNFIKSVDVILGDAQTGGKDKSRFTLDKGSGTLYVRARPSKVLSIEKLIAQGKSFRKRQVQIDAQLIDVQLNDNSQLGIDWNLLNSHLVGRLGAVGTSLSGLTTPLSAVASLTSQALTIPPQIVGGGMGAAGSTGAGIGFQNNVFSATVNALREFGSIKILSNPTIRVRNGTPAYLSVGKNVRYVQKLTSNTSNTGGSSTTSVDVQTDSLFSGVVVGVSALIKADGFVELFVRPSQTQVDDQSLSLVDVGSGNKVTLPVINTKSITTTLNIHDGDTVVIGGLIDQKVSSTDQGVPALSDWPVLGNLFNSTGKVQTTRELVIVLRVRVL